MQRICTDQDLISLYFEVIKQIHPNAIVDIGMLLKRCGILSRQFDTYEIPLCTKMTGIDFLPDWNAEIYRSVYDEVITARQMLTWSKGKRADLVFFLEPDLYCQVEEQKEIWTLISQIADYAVTDAPQGIWAHLTGKHKDLSMGTAAVKLLFFEDS